jgi:hypothetical protein
MKLNLGDLLFPNDTLWQRRYKLKWIFGTVAGIVLIVVSVTAIICQASHTRLPSLKHLIVGERTAHAREAK